MIFDLQRFAQEVSLVGGNYYIDNDDFYTAISGGKGNDTITNSGSYSSINAGKGNDFVSLTGDGNLIQYASGDGNDTIYGFKENSTLSVAEESTPLSRAGLMLSSRSARERFC